jgi:hypothetical protein
MIDCFEFKLQGCTSSDFMGRLPKVKQFFVQEDQHRTNPTTVKNAVHRPCCSRGCKKEIPDVARVSLEWRTMYANMTLTDRRSYLLNCVRRWLRDDGSVQWMFESCDGRRYHVCKKGLRDLTGIGGAALNDRHSRALAGHTSWQSVSTHNEMSVAPYYQAWLNHQIKTHAEHMPDAPWCTFRCSTRGALFKRFEQDWKNNRAILPHGRTPSLPTFYRILCSPEFKKKIRWYRYIRFSKCQTCAYLNCKIACAKGPDEKALFQRTLDEHNLYQGFEVIFYFCALHSFRPVTINFPTPAGLQRQAVYDVMIAAQMPEPQVLMIYLDGMDQNCSTLGHRHFTVGGVHGVQERLRAWNAGPCVGCRSVSRPSTGTSAS